MGAQSSGRSSSPASGALTQHMGVEHLPAPRWCRGPRPSGQPGLPSGAPGNQAQTAGEKCTAGAKQGRGWGGTGRPHQEVASAVTGEHGARTGPGRQPVLSRDNQTLLCPLEGPLTGSGSRSARVTSSFWCHADESLPPSCRGEHSACPVGGWGWGKLPL